MKYIDAEKLKAEIERRKKLLTPHKGQGVILCREIIKQFDSLLSFIDTISQPIMRDDIIDEIRAEIKRRFSEYNHDSSHHIQAAECASILDFLDTLSEDPDKSLEEEYKDYVESDPVYSKLVNRIAGLSIARHFANWQKEQDERVYRKFFNDRNQGDASFYDLLAYREGHRDGMDEQKEQMMKGAVEGEVENASFGIVYLRKNLTNDGYSTGDKVRIIVLPKEDEK